MKLRSATNADAEKIRALVFGILTEYGMHGDPEGMDADLDDIEAGYLARGGMFTILEREDGALIGTIGLYPKSEGVCELRKMYLAREARGQGLGKRLLQEALDQARRLHFRRIELETSSRLVEAIGLYTRYGFRPIATEHICERCDRALALDLDADDAVPPAVSSSVLDIPS